MSWLRRAASPPSPDERLAMQRVLRQKVDAGLLELAGHRADGQVVYRQAADLSNEEWQQACEAFQGGGSGR